MANAFGEDGAKRGGGFRGARRLHAAALADDCVKGPGEGAQGQKSGNTDRRRRFEAVALHHLDAAYALARWLTRNDDDAADAVQEAFLRAFCYFDSYRGDDAKSWVLKIVRRTCYSWLERRVSRQDGNAHYLMRLLPYWASDSTIDGVLATFVDITTIIAAEEHQRLLIAELNHRVRNMLGLVMGIATQTLSKSLGEATTVETFLDRIHALAGAYELLSRVTWGDVPLRDLVVQQLQPYLTEARTVTTEGASVSLRPKAILALGMVIHELATNAMKHGALSVPEGRVDVTWSVENGEKGRCLILNWREAGGPAVGEPIRKGFGSELIARTMSYQLDGEVMVDFAAEGLRTTLIMPFTLQLGDVIAR